MQTPEVAGAAWVRRWGAGELHLGGTVLTLAELVLDLFPKPLLHPITPPLCHRTNVARVHEQPSGGACAAHEQRYRGSRVEVPKGARCEGARLRRRHEGEPDVVKVTVLDADHSGVIRGLQKAIERLQPLRRRAIVDISDVPREPRVWYGLEREVLDAALELSAAPQARRERARAEAS